MCQHENVVNRNESVTKNDHNIQNPASVLTIYQESRRAYGTAVSRVVIHLGGAISHPCTCLICMVYDTLY